MKTTAITAAALASARPASLLAGDYGGKSIPIGVQLYSVRKECAMDLPGTLAALSKDGFKGVEFADYFGRDAQALRRMLQDAGLACCGSHIRPFDSLLGDQLARTIEFNHTLGNRFLIVPSLPDAYTRSRAGWQQAADLFGVLADKLKPYGMEIGFHNESSEFKMLDGERPWDTFFDRAKPEVVIQLDTGNAAEGGADPVALLKRHPGRVASLHVKAFSKSKPGAILGDDELPWTEIFRVAEAPGSVRWYIIEYESDLYPPLVAVQKSLEVMRRWGKC